MSKMLNSWRLLLPSPSTPPPSSSTPWLSAWWVLLLLLEEAAAAALPLLPLLLPLLLPPLPPLLLAASTVIGAWLDAADALSLMVAHDMVGLFLPFGSIRTWGACFDAGARFYAARTECQPVYQCCGATGSPGLTVATVRGTGRASKMLCPKVPRAESLAAT
jgi:hypothetical protein